MTRLAARRAIQIAATVVLTGLCTAYLVWQIDVSRTASILAHAHVGYFLAALAIMVVTVWPVAWRWQQVLRAKGIEESLGWLTRSYFVSYTAGQVLPTSVGGDAARIYETMRRHPGRGGHVSASVLLERALAGVATIALAAAGFALAIGHYDVGAYLWIELAFVVGTIVLGIVLFSRRLRPTLARLVPPVRKLRLERPIRAVYEGLHSYRDEGRLLVGLTVISVFLQVVRVLTIWLCAKSVGIDLSPRPFYVMGPLLFLVMLMPFTINGLAVRESFFVSFLGNLGVDADSAFAAGFLFFVVHIALSLPGAAILAWEGLRGRAQASTDHG